MFVKILYPACVGIGLARKGNIEGEHMIRTEAGARLEELAETTNQEACPDEQNERQGKFACREKSLETMV